MSLHYSCNLMGSSGGVAIRYGLDSPGIEFRLGHLSRPAPGPTQPPVKLEPGLFLWVLRRHGVDHTHTHTHHLAARLKKE